MKAMARHPGDPRVRQTTLAILFSLAYVTSLWACLQVSGRLGVPPFWPCNAFIAAAVVTLGRRAMAGCIAFCALCSLTFYLHFSHGWEIGALRGLLNIGEGVLAGVLARKVLGPRRLLRSSVGFAKLQLLAVGPACLLHWGLTMLALRLLDPGAAAAWRSACLPHLLGLASVLTALLLILQTNPAELKRSPLETVAVLACIAICSYLTFRFSPIPAQILITPLLILGAFRLGPRGGVLGALTVGLVQLPFAITGKGTYALHPQWSLQDRATIYGGVFLSTLFAVSLCAFMVAEQARLRRLLTRRAVAARDARRRALVASRSKTEFLAT